MVAPKRISAAGVMAKAGVFSSILVIINNLMANDLCVKLCGLYYSVCLTACWLAISGWQYLLPVAWLVYRYSPAAGMKKAPLAGYSMAYSGGWLATGSWLKADVHSAILGVTAAFGQYG